MMAMSGFLERSPDPAIKEMVWSSITVLIQFTVPFGQALRIPVACACAFKISPQYRQS
jgi:hypothetical protein